MGGTRAASEQYGKPDHSSSPSSRSLQNRNPITGCTNMEALWIGNCNFVIRSIVSPRPTPNSAACRFRPAFSPRLCALCMHDTAVSQQQTHPNAPADSDESSTGRRAGSRAPPAGVHRRFHGGSGVLRTNNKNNTAVKNNKTESTLS